MEKNLDDDWQDESDDLDDEEYYYEDDEPTQETSLMPTRTDEERALIDSLPIKEPDEKCNARTPRGYCGKTAGFGTEHVGSGRCKFHGGGENTGRPATSGMYSKKLTSNLRKDMVVYKNDPERLNVYQELDVLRTGFGNFLENVQHHMADPNRNIWITTNRKTGEEKMSGKAKVFLELVKNITACVTAINKIENSSKYVLTIQQVDLVLKQIRYNMDDTCGECPVRKELSFRLDRIKTPGINSNEQTDKK
jgi:hypothetical protein